MIIRHKNRKTLPFVCRETAKKYPCGHNVRLSTNDIGYIYGYFMDGTVSVIVGDRKVIVDPETLEML